MTDNKPTLDKDGLVFEYDYSSDPPSVMVYKGDSRLCMVQEMDDKFVLRMINTDTVDLLEEELSTIKDFVSELGKEGYDGVFADYEYDINDVVATGITELDEFADGKSMVGAVAVGYVVGRDYSYSDDRAYYEVWICGEQCSGSVTRRANNLWRRLDVEDMFNDVESGILSGVHTGE